MRGLAHPASITLASIDGLYFHHNSLIAIQNGCIVHRVAAGHGSGGRDIEQRVAALQHLGLHNAIERGIQEVTCSGGRAQNALQCSA